MATAEGQVLMVSPGWTSSTSAFGSGRAAIAEKQSLHINVDLLLRQSVLTPKLGKC